MSIDKLDQQFLEQIASPIGNTKVPDSGRSDEGS